MTLHGRLTAGGAGIVGGLEQKYDFPTGSELEALQVAEDKFHHDTRKIDVKAEGII